MEDYFEIKQMIFAIEKIFKQRISDHALLILNTGKL